MSDLLFLSASELSSLRKSQGWKVSEKVVSDFSVLGDPKNEAFRPGWLDFHRQPATKSYGESFFSRTKCRNLFGGLKHGNQVGFLPIC